jgi:type IV pilus assembly protein PilO
MTQQIRDLTQEIKKMEVELTKAWRTAGKLSELKNRRIELKALLEELVAQLPDTKEIPELLIQISQLGKKSGLEFTLFKPKPEQPAEFYVKIPIEMEMKGGYHNLAKFFDRVGNLSRIVNITNIRIADPKVEGKDVILKANCLAFTFRSLTPEEMERQAHAHKRKK